MKRLGHILESINIGIVIIDKNYNITEWNNWMIVHSDITKEEILGKNIFEIFPELNRPCFTRGSKTVFTFGNLVFLSSKLHKFLFPFKLRGAYSSMFEYMQQSCYLIPVRDNDGEIDGLMINVHDVTENAVLERHLKEMSYVDGLTGAYNRRTFDLRIQEEFTRHKRTDAPLSIILFDLDHFKTINDQYGHPFGDTVLQELVKACSSKLRAEDYLARYGGEEFVCILINQNLEQASLVAERLRKSIEGLFVTEGDISVSLTISLGIADSSMCDTHEEMLILADSALYKAKKEGRNRVERP